MQTYSENVTNNTISHFSQTNQQKLAQMVINGVDTEAIVARGFTEEQIEAVKSFLAQEVAKENGEVVSEDTTQEENSQTNPTTETTPEVVSESEPSTIPVDVVPDAGQTLAPEQQGQVPASDDTPADNS